MNELVKKRGRDQLLQQRGGNERIQEFVTLLKHVIERILEGNDFVRILVVKDGVLGKRSKQCEGDETQTVVDGFLL